MIRHTVRFPAPQSHYAEVEVRMPTDGSSQLEVFLPVWTPGSYLVREYARSIEALTAAPHTARKTRKNRWVISTANPINEITIRYRLYCHELSVRTNWVDETFALIVGAASFLCPVNGLQLPHEVTLQLPAGWSGSWSGMPGSDNCFTAPDYDTLVDSPIVAGSPAVYPFEVDGKPHLLVNIGEAGLWDGEKSVRDLQRVVRQHAAMWGFIPYENYLFLNLLVSTGGGLEHLNSTVLMSDRFAMRTRASYLAWLDLACHEYFHVWNVKRLRPVELGPFDYENEVYTSNLWIAEGFTEYYSILALCRSGLMTVAEFLGTEGPSNPSGHARSISGLVEQLQTTPGRLQQPLTSACFDAWIKLYRPDENSINSAISYYTKGAVVAWMLDARIRCATGGKQSLDDAMRLAFSRHSGSKGFSTDDFLYLIQELTNDEVSHWLNTTVSSTEELDYGQTLAWFGLRFRPVPSVSKVSGGKAWCGMSTKSLAGRLMVAQVTQGTPASVAGVSPDDEILGIDGYRVLPEQWETRMEQYAAGQEVTLSIARRDRLIQLPIRLGREPGQCWRVEVDPEATPLQKQRFAAWLEVPETSGTH